MSGDMTLAEELHFIHSHIEQIDVRIDGIEEELKALNVLIRQMVKIFDRMAFMVDKSIEDPHSDDRGQRVR